MEQKQEIPEKNHQTHPQAEPGCFICDPSWPQTRSGEMIEQFRALKISDLNHSAMEAIKALLKKIIESTALIFRNKHYKKK